MNTDKDIALKYLNTDCLLNASIIDPINNGTATILFASPNCVYVKDNSSPVYMLQTEDLALADKILDTIPADAALVAHNDALAEFAIKKLGYKGISPCYQGVYYGKPFEYTTDLTIRLMREDEAADASEMYHFDEASALRHIKRGLIYGAYLNGEIAGMVGMHYQGSMGLLEVKPKFRRRGYGEVLEKFIINSVLSKGQLPYCQIVKNNEVSLSLQRKLGLTISNNLLYWLHKEEE